MDTFAHVPATRFTDIAPYATPHGIAARYRGSWQGPDRAVLRQEGVTLVTFAGDLIAQIGIHLKAEELRALASGGHGRPGALIAALGDAEGHARRR